MENAIPSPQIPALASRARRPVRKSSWIGAILFLGLAAPAGPLFSQNRSEAGAVDAYFRSLPVYTIPMAEEPAENSFRMAFRVAGPANRRTIVFLHGISGSGYSFASLARELEGGFRLIIVDLPAYGDSFTPRPIDFSYASMMRRLLVLLKAVDALDGALLVGHSTGGALAWHLDLEAACRPAGLVLIDAVTVEYDPDFRIRLAFSLLRASRFFGPIMNLVGNDVLARIIAKGAASKSFKPSPESVERLLPLFTTPARIRVNALWAHQLLDPNVVRSWAPSLAKIEAPVSLIWGREDAVLIPDMAAQAQAHIPRSTAVIIEGAGHSPHGEKPGEVARLIRDFARELPLSEREPRFGPEVQAANSREIVWPTLEMAGSMTHLTLSVSGYPGGGAVDAAAFHLKRGYYSTDYPSQSGSVGLFLEYVGRNGAGDVFAGGQLELVWRGIGGFRAAQGWNLSGGSNASRLTKIGYVPSYAPWVCLGASWFGRETKPGFFLTLELAPRLWKKFLF